MTIGQNLRAIQAQKRQDRIELQSDILREFVKDDLLCALQRAVSDEKDYEAVLAPKEIRRLFAGKLISEDLRPQDDPRSAFHEVWQELKTWADDENLVIHTGHHIGPRGQSTPWHEQNWGGYLTVAKPKATRSTPVSKKTTGGFLSLETAWSCVILVIGVLLLMIIT